MWLSEIIETCLIFQENVYGLLSKVYEAKKTCIQQGNHNPSREDIAACAGISVERMEKLLSSARVPLSMQQPVWMDQTTTFQVSLFSYNFEKISFLLYLVHDFTLDRDPDG